MIIVETKLSVLIIYFIGKWIFSVLGSQVDNKTKEGHNPNNHDNRSSEIPNDQCGSNDQRPFTESKYFGRSACHV